MFYVGSVFFFSNLLLLLILKNIVDATIAAKWWDARHGRWDARFGQRRRNARYESNDANDGCRRWDAGHRWRSGWRNARYKSDDANDGGGAAIILMEQGITIVCMVVVPGHSPKPQDERCCLIFVNPFLRTDRRGGQDPGDNCYILTHVTGPTLHASMIFRCA